MLNKRKGQKFNDFAKANNQLIQKETNKNEGLRSNQSSGPSTLERRGNMMMIDKRAWTRRIKRPMSVDQRVKRQDKYHRWCEPRPTNRPTWLETVVHHPIPYKCQFLWAWMKCCPIHPKHLSPNCLTITHFNFYFILLIY